MMDDKEKNELVDNVLSGKVRISELSESCFHDLLDGLKRMYFSRVMNCIDASAKWDQEWLVLSDIFQRICEGYVKS